MRAMRSLLAPGLTACGNGTGRRGEGMARVESMDEADDKEVVRPDRVCES